MGFVKHVPNQPKQEPKQQEQAQRQQAAPPKYEAPPAKGVSTKGSKPDYIIRCKDPETGKLERVGSAWRKRDRQTGKETGALDLIFDPGITLTSTEADRCKLLMFVNDAEQKFGK